MSDRQDSDALCSVTIIHQEILEKVRDQMTKDSQLVQMAELFKAFDDPTRLKIINALLLAEMCVCDISTLLNMTQPAISHHLKVLRQTQLVKYRRDGKIVYYSLDDDHIALLFQQGLAHVTEKWGREEVS
ncbi:MAG: ArsR/SmtB family transcription factor [Anaerolineaceae bacterium]